MRISRIKIENFRSIRTLDMTLGDTTVLMGQNNGGKTAILDAIRIVLTRRWGSRGTGFAENDVHRRGPEGDPRALPPIRIAVVVEEREVGDWDQAMVAGITDIADLTEDGRNIVTVQVTYAWSEEKDAFDPVWRFLGQDGEPMRVGSRSTNFNPFFDGLPLFWLDALRDASKQFDKSSGFWSRLMRSVRIPDDREAEVLEALQDLDTRLVDAAPKLSEIADTISQATRVAIGEGPGAARLSTLPLGMEEVLQRTGVVLRNEELLPWLPLDHHGQGLQSLAVIFLFQAVVAQQLAEARVPGVEPVFTIEEPEAHLHPQAARTLWDRMRRLPGQKVMTTHSPHFLEHVPLRDVRLVRLRDGQTRLSLVPTRLVSDLPWNEDVERINAKGGGRAFLKDERSGRVAARSWFNEAVADRLLHCLAKGRGDPEYGEREEAVHRFRRQCRILPTAEEEAKLAFHGRRGRGDIFFARRWLLVEGVTEYLLVHAIGHALGRPLDAHGVAIVDFQQSGNSPGTYASLAEAFGIDWHLISDGDGGGEKFRSQILKRGFTEDDLTDRLETLPKPHDLEAQLVADGHLSLLAEAVSELEDGRPGTMSEDEVLAGMRRNKVRYMSAFSARVAEDAALAKRMPAPFVNYVLGLPEAL